MAHWRRAGGHPDKAQPDLVKFARRLGASVKIVSQVGDFVDAAIGFRGSNLLWEIKNPGEIRNDRKGRKQGGQLTPDQVKLRANWRGRIDLIQTTDDVLKALLAADMNRPIDYQDVPDDFLAAMIKSARQAGLHSPKRMSEDESTD